MIKVTAYTNPESIVINSLRDLAATTTEDGWKVVLRFRDEDEMKELQDALNYLFPQNMKTMQEMPFANRWRTIGRTQSHASG